MLRWWCGGVIVAAGCGQGGAAVETGDATGATTGTVGPTEASSAGESSSGGVPVDPMIPPRPAVQPCHFEGQAPGILPPLELVPIFAGEVLTEVVDVAPADAAGRVLVAERGGRIWVGEKAEGALTQVIDLGARGRLVALAPAPDFATSGHLFVRYEAASGASRAVVARFTVDLVSWTADLASERSVMQIADAVGERSGAALVFDAGGMLVIGVGDLGGAVVGVSQDPSKRAGKLLRVDVGPLEQSGTFAIPADNPFIGLGGAADEVWALGLRDPSHCSRADAGALWCTDIGEVEHEVDRVAGGENLGWPNVEGWTCHLPGGDCSSLYTLRPTASYRGGEGDCGVSGALFGLSPGLEANLMYADRCSGRVRGVDQADPGTVVQEEILAQDPAGVVGLVRDGSGEPIAILGDGRLARVVVTPAPGEFPLRLSEAGCFADVAAQTPVPGVVPYGINAPLWTDGAIKSRWMALPVGAAISVQADGSLEFPVGAVLLKTFAFEQVAGDPATVLPVETRVMVRREHGWQFHSYRWNSAGTDAELLVSGVRAKISVEEEGAAVEFNYEWPSRGTCKVCHGFGVSRALGPRLDQLSGEHDYGGAIGDQLAVLAGLDMFAEGLPAQVPAIARPDDEAQEVEARARAYLHGNCGHCHRPGGWTPPDLTMDMRWTTDLVDTHICGVATQYPNPWAAGEVRVVPGDPENSAIWQRIHQRGPGQMPPVGTSRVDPGAAVVHAWIEQLKSCP